MGKRKSAADVTKAVEKQARSKKASKTSETRKPKGGELDVRVSKVSSKF